MNDSKDSRTHARAKFFKIFMLLMAVFLIAISSWTQRFFGKVSINQVLSTLDFSQNGVFEADPIFFKRWIEWCVLGPLCLTGFLYTIRKLMIIRWCMRVIRYPLLFIWLGTIGYASYQFSLIYFFKSFYQPQTDFFEQAYVDPHRLIFYKNHPKNLLVIYVESLEATYKDPELFGHNLLKKLDDFKKTDHAFSFEYHQAEGTGWTIGGLVATQCGLPLKITTIFNNNRFGENISHFLPGAKCLSDILAENGYRNIFMGGASLHVGGKGKFLEDHHYHEVIGKNKWIENGFSENKMSGWGLTDDNLFEQAKLKLAALMKTKQLFNLTLLTVDMHGVHGYLNSSCQRKGYQGFAGIVECTANETADFIQYVKNQGWLEQIDILVLGDHLAMKNDVTAILNKSQNRTIYNLFISQKRHPINTYEITTYDILPSLLDYVGVSYNQGQLGLGYSAMRKASYKNKPSLDELQKYVEYHSKFYNQLWVSTVNAVE